MHQCCAEVLPAWFGLRGEAAFSQVPACTAGCVPPWSNVASHDEPPFVLSLHLMFCGMLMHPILACVAALQCAFGTSVPSGGALQVPPVPGPPASGLRSFSFSLLCVHLSAASIFAMLRMILERVRCAGPCVCSAGLDSSSSSFRIHGACFKTCFASLLSNAAQVTL